MTGRERVDAALSFREPDRIAISDAPWFSAVLRWQQEGLPADVAVEDYFGYEIAQARFDRTLRLPASVVEETEEYIIEWSPDGTLRKNWKKATSSPEQLDFRIKSRVDWEELKHCAAFSPDRLDIPAMKAAQAKANAEGRWFCLACAIGYDRTQGVIGMERLLMAMAEEPDWIREMVMAWSVMFVEAGEELIGAGVQFDGCFLFDDHGYTRGLLFSPRMFRELLFDAHKLVYDWAASHGLKCILHSDGRVVDLIPQYLEAGLTCLQPLEVKAGMDVVELKKQYGERLAFMGGIDVRAMAHPDPQVIEAEIAGKIPFAMKGGGYIYHSDHSVPDNVSLAQYERTLELVRRYGTY